MKNIILLFSLVIFLFFTRFSYAQISETSMKDITETVTDKIKTLEDIEDMEVVNITIDLLVGTSGEKYVYRYLDNSFDYKILVFGDRRINKMNVVVRKKNEDKWIMVDKATGKTALLDLYPDSRAFYEFTLSIAELNDDFTAGHFAVLIYHKDPLKK
jgi:hypothetical protein